MGKEDQSLISRVQEQLEKPIVQINRRLLRKNVKTILEKINQKYFFGKGQFHSWERNDFSHVDVIKKPVFVNREGKEFTADKKEHHGLVANICGLITPDLGALIIIEPTLEHYLGKNRKTNTIWVSYLNKDQRAKMDSCAPNGSLSLNIPPVLFTSELNNLLEMTLQSRI